MALRLTQLISRNPLLSSQEKSDWISKSKQMDSFEQSALFVLLTDQENKLKSSFSRAEQKDLLRKMQSLFRKIHETEQDEDRKRADEKLKQTL